MNTFAVTACGRSGTKFLAQALNTSPTWEVNHESKRDRLIVFGADVQPRFDHRDRYGEVNGYLTPVLLELAVDQRAVILRDPRTIIVSAVNRSQALLLRDRRPWLKYLGMLGRHCRALRDLADREDVLEISFRRMVTDLEYLRSIAEALGVLDAEFDARTLATKIDSSRRARIREVDQFDEQRRAETNQVVGPFVERFTR